MPTSSGASRVVYLHIGPPKTGTTYLQDVMWRNRAELPAQGITYAAAAHAAHFQAALDLRGIRFGGYDNPAVPGAWQRLVDDVAAVDTPAAFISHEVFGGATEAEIAKLASDLGEVELHVVCGARDLARQLPAVWQESLKNRRTQPFDEFCARVARTRAKGNTERGFWRAQDTVSMLRRWSAVTPPDRIHVVTLPQRGAPADTLWTRFSGVVGIAPDALDLDVARSNVSLGAEDAELLRRLNEALPDDLPWPAYDRLVKRRFRRLAVRHDGTGTPIRVPDSYAEALAGYTSDIQTGLAAGGYDIVGDLADLTPVATSYAADDPTAGAIVSDADVDALASEVIRKARRDPRESTRARTLMAQLRRGRRS